MDKETEHELQNIIFLLEFNKGEVLAGKVYEKLSSDPMPSALRNYLIEQENAFLNHQSKYFDAIHEINRLSSQVEQLTNKMNAMVGSFNMICSATTNHSVHPGGVPNFNMTYLCK